MRHLLIAFALIPLLWFCRQNSSAQEREWQPLFDGKTLKGWHTYGRQEPGAAWDVDKGAIHLKPAKSAGYQTEGGGDLVTDREFDNFHLKLEWMIAPKGNSGIIFYVKEDTAKFKETWYTGPEMQVLDINGNEDSHVYKHDIGDLYDLVSATTHPGKPANEWNRAEIKSVNGKLDLYLNGEHVASTTLWDDNWRKTIADSKFKDMPGFGTFQSGKIALQDHGNEVWYRNIMIKEL